MDDARDDNLTARVSHWDEEDQMSPDRQRAHPRKKLTTTLATYRVGGNPVKSVLDGREVPQPLRLAPDFFGVAARILKVVKIAHDNYSVIIQGQERIRLRGVTTSQYTSGESMRICGSGSTRSPLARLSATSGSRASATPCPVSAACTIWCA